MRPSLHQVLPQNVYAAYLEETNAFTRDIIKSMPAEEVAKMRAYKTARNSDDSPNRRAFAKRLIAEQVKARTATLAKAGVNTGIGYNFYDLRGPAYLLYPVNTPFRNALPRSGKVNDGYGTAAHWMATRDFGTSYAGAAEGKRTAQGTPDKNDYIATYKEIGHERAVTFTAQFAGEGYTDNVADEHLRGLHALWLQEEALDLLGNAGDGTGNNGFKLGTCNTPVATLVTGTGALTTSKYYSAYCVAITALGYPNNAQYGYLSRPTVASGLTPSFTRTNADGTTDTINGGISAISAVSNVVQVSGTDLAVKFVVTPKAGAIAYAWFLDKENTNTSSAANALLAAITTIPSFTAIADATGTQAANAAGLNTDHSFQTLDYDGLLTYAAKTGRWVDQKGANLTSDGANGIVEIDTDLQYFWDNFQAEVEAIWCAADAKVYIDQTIMANGGNPGAFRFEYARDSQNNILGGSVISAYQSKFAMSQLGGKAIPMRIHPMLPPGTIYYDIGTNPYPHSRIPFVRGMLVQRDYYSIEWPIVTRQWTFGTYVHQVLAHHVPWITGVRTGIGGADT